METQFFCKNERRREALRNQSTINGIDYIEVESPDQLTLAVHFLHNLPGQPSSVPAAPAPELKKENLIIDGGVRIKNVQVEKVSALNNVFKIIVNEPGDFSKYTLRLVTSQKDRSAPKGFDTQLSAVEFSFKAACPSEFDCKAVRECPPPQLTNPEIDYLAKDYAGFRRLILDRLSVIMQDWQDRSPADVQMLLVELLAYVGDNLSYYQDAVATEAYLGTARKRVSLRRHARLLDYHVHDGCNARSWVWLEAKKSADGKILPLGTRLLTRGSDGKVPVATDDFEKALEQKPLVFETMHQLTLQSAHNEISFYTWGDSECCLPRGSTRATLLGEFKSLKKGDVLIFEERVGAVTGAAADADPTHRHAVRLKEVLPDEDRLDGTKVTEIEWHQEDALPFPLCISARIIDAGGNEEVKEISVALGNVVLVDHGRAVPDEPLPPVTFPEGDIYRPKLLRPGLTFGVPYNHETAKQQAAARAIEQNPQEALPSRMSLWDGNDPWEVRRDLLGSDRFAADFVVEMETGGVAQLRFGDGVSGKKPAAGTTFSATYRIGSGRMGNVGAGAITRLVWDFDDFIQVRNPMPATGGTDPETMEQVRQFAPQAFRKQQRAVTEADYVEVAQRYPDVQKAAAAFRWTGSWYTVFVTIDRRGGREVDAEFEDEMRRHLGKFRLAGYDLEINAPVFVSLYILMIVCVKPGHFRTDVKGALMKAFSRRDLPDGSRGFFHPDNFSFGQPVFLSQVYQQAMRVAGVASVEAKRFQRWGKAPGTEIDDGFLAPAPLEIVRLDNDPNFPENGKIDFEMYGGL